MMKKSASAIITAMVIVAILGIAAAIAVYVSTPVDISPSMTGDVDTTVSWPDSSQSKTKTIEVDAGIEPETRVLLVDESGSMANNINAFTGYDVVVSFSDYLMQSSGDTRIGSCLSLVLDMGIKEVGIVSDLEVYPRSDLEVLDGKFYTSRELMVFVPKNVEMERYQLCREAFANILEEETSTLVFVYPDGTRDVVFDNYIAPEEKTITAEVEVHPQQVIPVIDVMDNREVDSGNYIAPSTVRNERIIYISIITMLVEIILALLLFHVKKEPDWVGKAISTKNIALDGSGSVATIYDEMLMYLKFHKRNLNSIWRFADTVEKVSLTEARLASPGGQTHGWECLQKMQTEGISEVTLVSDLGFNDAEVSGLHFTKIIFVVPNAFSAQMLDKLKGICDTYEVISL